MPNGEGFLTRISSRARGEKCRVFGVDFFYHILNIFWKGKIVTYREFKKNQFSNFSKFFQKLWMSKLNKKIQNLFKILFQLQVYLFKKYSDCFKKKLLRKNLPFLSLYLLSPNSVHSRYSFTVRGPNFVPCPYCTVPYCSVFF